MLVNGQPDTSQADSQILHPGSRTLYRFWETTRAAQSAPSRNTLDLSQIRELVPNLFIIARDGTSRMFRWRLAGTRACDLFRRELTGGDVLAGWDSFQGDIISRFLGGVVQNLQPCILRLRLRTDLGQMIGVEMVGLPIQASDGQNIHIFGGLFPFRETGLLSYQQISQLELSGARTIWTEHLPGDLLAQQLEANTQRPFQPFQVISGGRK